MGEPRFRQNETVKELAGVLDLLAWSSSWTWRRIQMPSPTLPARNCRASWRCCWVTRGG